MIRYAETGNEKQDKKKDIPDRADCDREFGFLHYPGSFGIYRSPTLHARYPLSGRLQLTGDFAPFPARVLVKLRSTFARSYWRGR